MREGAIQDGEESALLEGLEGQRAGLRGLQGLDGVKSGYGEDSFCLFCLEVLGGNQSGGRCRIYLMAERLKHRRTVSHDRSTAALRMADAGRRYQQPVPVT